MQTNQGRRTFGMGAGGTTSGVKMEGGHMSKQRVIVLDQQLVKSGAWLRLTGAAPQVYLVFRCKCQIKTLKGKPGKGRRVIANNGQIVFTYSEAEKQYGLTKPRFMRAIDQLVEYGFIDIAATGCGHRKMTTMYSISDRWRQYRTAAFVNAKRKRSTANPGFQKGHKLWKQKEKAK